MNFLFDNPLANMQGPTFLVFYAVAIATAIFVYWLIKNNLDLTSKCPLPPIPHNPDAYEIAYLRGGENEVARAVIFSLMQKGLIEMSKAGREHNFQQTKNQSDGNLLPIESSTLNWFRLTRTTREVFAEHGLKLILQPFCTQYDANMKRQNLLTDSATRNRIWQTAIPFALAILGFGGYKLAAAISHGRSNIGLLFVFGIIGTVILIFVAKSPRISKLGKSYLARLQTVFGSVTKSVANQTTVANTAFNAIDPLLLTVGVFGVGALAGTAYGEYEKAFHRASSSSSCGNGCGSLSCSSGDSGGSSCSSGSSCSGGSSCGSSCGGCSS